MQAECYAASYYSAMKDRIGTRAERTVNKQMRLFRMTLRVVSASSVPVRPISLKSLEGHKRNALKH